MRRKSRSNHLPIALLAIACGCGDVSGGAAELSWKFRPASSALEDKFVECNSNQDGTGPVTAIRLDWTVDVLVNGQIEQQVDSDEWPCGDSHGVTGFVLPEGSALFSIVPLCESGPAVTASYIVPAVEQRQVIVGDTVNLGAIEVVVQVADCGVQPCICE